MKGRSTGPASDLTFADLDGIARRSAAQTSSDLRDDVYQESWLRFLRYPPPNRTYAWRSANSARISLYRSEARFQRVKELAPILFELPQPSAAEKNRHDSRRYYREHRPPPRQLAPADPNGTAYWRDPERHRRTARLRMRRWRALGRVQSVHRVP